MKKYIVIISLILTAGLTGCSSLRSVKEKVFGKASRKENEAQNIITKVESKQAEINNKRLKEIGTFSFGINYDLSKINLTNETQIAYDLNTRVQSLSEQPSLSAMKEMKKIVDEMLVNNTATLEKKD
ncbi:MAG: hypothetical protein AABY22_25660, partial [Nanoarchaeota archaeon]